MTVIVLHGRNTVDIDERISDLLHSLDPQRLNTTTLDIDSCDISDIRAAVSTPGFFGTSRVVLIRGIPAVDKSPRTEWKDLEDVLAEAPENATIVLATTLKTPANRRVLKVAKSNGWQVELHDLFYGQPLVQWVQRRTESYGGEIDAVASRDLLGRLFPTSWQREDRWNLQSINMRLLATEIEKLVSGASGGVVTAETIRRLTPDHSGVTAFKLNDETFEGRTAEALVELDNILATGEAPERVIGQIGYQPLVMYAAMHVQRYGPDSPAEAAGISAGQLKATISRKSAWKNRSGMTRAVEALRRSEWLVKTGRSPSSKDVLAPLVAEIADGFRS
ncbi:hypothetical protein BH23CHL2_BH23CHL2_35860 [soil metagenome]